MVTSNKQENIKRAVEFIGEAAKNNAKIISLPECFNSPYGVKYFPEYCESIPDGETTRALASAARDNKVYVIGGSIPESDGGKLYNTCAIFDPNGNLIAKHRKVSLFFTVILIFQTFSSKKLCQRSTCSISTSRARSHSKRAPT